MAGELSKIEHAIHKAIIPEERPTKQRSARKHQEHSPDIYQEHSPDIRGRLEEWLKLEKAVQVGVSKESMFHFHFCFIDSVGNRVDQQET